MAKSATPTKAHNRLRVVIRPYPKVVFFYMTWIASLICAIASDGGAPGQAPNWIGVTWMSAFLFNLLVSSRPSPGSSRCSTPTSSATSGTSSPGCSRR